ncbi:neural cell adhesion molecule 1-like [Scyliorhinus canicula]|uniref:neural cell adhesion molecule 1-like n=1 Tax=Scyliorhinus canicula TaxID=7830 RepID=UPI0018F31356|nr:neural cell adhesion molecule 1-like [Scyliorhinus canicula]
MSLRTSIYACILILGSATAGRPKLRIEPLTGYIYLNEDKVFICKVEGEAEELRWFDKLGKEIDQDANGRFTLERSEYDLLLKIRNAQWEDSGIYKCRAETENSDEIEKSINITVIRRPKLRIEPLTGNIDLNKDKVFICKVEGEAEELRWFDKLEEEIDLDANGRFTLEKSEYDLQLQIRNAQWEDSGTYKCTAETENGDEIEKSINIKVIQRVTFFDVISNLEFDESDFATLDCNVTGFPEPTVSWTRDDQDVTQQDRFQKLNNNSLVIRNIQPSDAGIYFCVGRIAARNEQESTRITVKVNYAPRLESPASEVFTWLGNPVNVSCSVKSFPQATFNWSHQGGELGESANVSIVANGDVSVSMVEVTVDSEADLGEYTCSARNRLGKGSRSIWVKEAEFPSAPLNLTVEPHSTTVQVSLGKPASDGGIPILGYKLEWKSDAAEWKSKMTESETFRITELEPYIFYQFRAAARNGKGLGEYSRTVSAKTLSIREPDRPKLTTRKEGDGNAYRIYFKDTESGGSSVLRHNIKYKAEHAPEWINDTVNGSDSYLLNWATHYQVQVAAENRISESLETFLNFTTLEQPPPLPSADSATGEKAKVGTAGIIGIILLIFLALLVVVDVTCYDKNQCGILMCIAVNVLGKPVAAVKRLEQEMGVTSSSANPKGNFYDLHGNDAVHKYSKTKNLGMLNDKISLTKSE